MNKSSRNDLPIIVSGGGIGGLACALALAQKQFRVLVCEQAPRFGQVGAGLQVAPNALSVLDALGVGGEIKRQALLIEQMLMMDGISGEPVGAIPCGGEFQQRFGNPYAVAHRADVHNALLEACGGHPLVELKTDTRIVGYEQQRENVVTATTDSGATLRGTALVGADGVHSRIRQQLIGDGGPVPIGAVIYRALIPASRMPRELQQPYPTLWTGPDAHLIYYPVSDWTQFNIGATVRCGAREMTEGEASAEEAAAAFADWAEVPRRVLSLAPMFQRYVLRQRTPAANWTAGRVTLLGDAAHPMVQYIAQGAAMALEDALSLATELDAADGDFEEAFPRYQDVRIVRSARVQISSLMLDRIYHAGGVERLVRNSVFAGRTPSEYYDRLAWLFTAPAYVRQWNASPGCVGTADGVHIAANAEIQHVATQPPSVC
ncbi:salicylate hydroxylase [Cupriavidus sp. YR651]|uniref:FAD-dependent monooxygenase n=1 Tax=Cupriavidus sp. YR651 TaxID=1855315 RepID=UPI000881ABBE|nr:FAD-dependent monooxygenase [Cupriavidus sp. YR651]SDC64829.1 salicylate hydroxylase [Cupriavidus sp. YR651]